MSAPAHVGDCPPMVWTRFADGRAPVIQKPWQRFIVVTEHLLTKSPYVSLSEDFSRWRVTCSNGWADYRWVGSDPDKDVIVLELVECG